LAATVLKVTDCDLLKNASSLARSGGLVLVGTLGARIVPINGIKRVKGDYPTQ
jgi:hypothetical protein